MDHLLSSSLRAVTPEETLENARELAASLGVTRVTQITKLDRVGLPVFSSIRPESKSISVNSGKGLNEIEAKVGAYMEAIEFAIVENARNNIPVTTVRIDDLLDGAENGQEFFHFCPAIGINYEAHEQIDCVEALDIVSGETTLVPAELVFHPFPFTYFGSNTNGLCSGNSLIEATLHGLSELIERDTSAHLTVFDDSKLVSPDSLPNPVKEYLTKFALADLEFCVRYSDGQFGVPYFVAMLFEKKELEPLYMTGGYGCHPYKQVALVRAVCEAAQSRLTAIHGGRDDLVDSFNRYKQWSIKEKSDYKEKLLSKMMNNSNVILFENIANYCAQQSINEVLSALISTLTAQGLNRILRVTFTDENDPIQVARILVPGLENFSNKVHRVGPRLAEFGELHLA